MIEHVEDRGNLILLVLFWELTSIFSFLLIGYWHQNQAARDGARMALTITAIGGLARYENDYYMQVSHDIANVPGNPWFIGTLWLAAFVVTGRWWNRREQSLPDSSRDSSRV